MCHKLGGTDLTKQVQGCCRKTVEEDVRKTAEEFRKRDPRYQVARNAFQDAKNAVDAPPPGWRPVALDGGERGAGVGVATRRQPPAQQGGGMIAAPRRNRAQSRTRVSGTQDAESMPPGPLRYGVTNQAARRPAGAPPQPATPEALIFNRRMHQARVEQTRAEQGPSTRGTRADDGEEEVAVGEEVEEAMPTPAPPPQPGTKALLTSDSIAEYFLRCDTVKVLLSVQN